MAAKLEKMGEQAKQVRHSSMSQQAGSAKIRRRGAKTLAVSSGFLNFAVASRREKWREAM